MDNKNQKKSSSLLQITCPCCFNILWIDANTRRVVRTEKGAKKKSSLEDLLTREKKKKSEADSRFLSTAELEREKKREAREKFEKALSNLDRDE